MYRYLDHTADLLIEVKAKDLKTLFYYAAIAILNYISDKNIELNKRVKKVYQYDGTLENIFVEFLNEILFLAYVKKLFLIKINKFEINEMNIKSSVNELEEITLKIECVFDKINNYIKEIKAITYCDIKITKKNQYIYVRFIADI
jgi:SHS2 domain-containing protein